MHIEVREIKGKKKYYLAHSHRRGKKVQKTRVYLGLDLSKEELVKKKKKAEIKLQNKIKETQVIRDPLKTILSPTEIGELKTLEAKGTIKIPHLSKEDWVKFIETFVYNTNAIEGSTINPKEVKNILKEGIWPEKPKEDISETYGVAEAIDYIKKAKEHISLNLIKELHTIVFKNSKPFAGKFRKKGVEVVIADSVGNIVHRGAPSTYVVNLLKELIEWYDDNKKRYPALVLAAVIHNQFENIHPFQDGNGRVGRLLMNNILLKHNKPPINIDFKNRSIYYAALQAYEHTHNLRPTIELMLKEYNSLKKLLKKKR